MPKKNRVLFDDIWFDSPQELNDYFYIKQHEKLKLIERQKKFHLLDGFKWFDIEKGKYRKTRDMVYTTDFIVTHEDYDKPIAWERKGYARKDYMQRKKLFLNKFKDEYYFLEIRSNRQRDELFGHLGDIKTMIKMVKQ